MFCNAKRDEDIWKECTILWSEQWYLHLDDKDLHVSRDKQKKINSNNTNF